MNVLVLVLALCAGIKFFAEQLKSSRVATFAFWVLVSPSLLCLFYSLWWAIQQELAFPSWLAGLALLVVGVGFLLRLLPTKLRSSLLDAVLTGLAFLLTFPFRLLWRMGQVWWHRERILREPLDPHRPLVGHPPPRQTEKRHAQKTD